jgi:hypothetical protein
MKALYTLTFFAVAIAPIFGQDPDPDPNRHEPEEKVDVKREFDEDGNIIKYDSTYSWSWSGEDFMDEEMRRKFQDKMDQLREEMEMFSDEFISGFHWDDKFLEGFEEFHKDFKMQFNDSLFNKEHFERFFDHNDFKFHGFNFDGNNLEAMPFDKEKMEEIEKRMKDLFDGKFDERIRKFIEDHKQEIDEIKYQIRESIPKHRKAI